MDNTIIKSQLNTLENSIKIKIKSKNNWIDSQYSWSINQNKLPCNIKLNNNLSNYFQNIELKRKLTSLYKISSKGNRKTLQSYYVSTWGGIHSNSDKTINFYVNSEYNMLKLLGKKGVASWSKILVVRNCRKYANFDARVSACLNALINNECKNPKYFFPILPSRNKNITKFNQKLKKSIHSSSYSYFSANDFYEIYINTIKKIAYEFAIEIFEVEMFLFANAEKIIKNKFNN